MAEPTAAAAREVSVIHHLGFAVSDFDRLLAFYEAALGPLGYAVVAGGRGQGYAGLGAEGRPDFWINGGGKTSHIHFAFAARDRVVVDAFYAAAIAAGGKDNGKPGPRPDNGPSYYAAYVLDPDGHNIEVVSNGPK